jgi:PPP family 3-phenylpropionic acid transporter
MSRRFVPHALIYAGYYGAVGVTVPFLPSDLVARGLVSREIGLVLAVPAFMSVVLPMIAGYLADRFQRAVAMLRALLFATCLTLFLLSLTQGFAQVMSAMVVHSIVSTPILVLVEAATLTELKKSGGSYGRVRLFGTLGFVLSAFLLGQTIRPALVEEGWVLRLAAASMFVAFLGSWLLRGATMSRSTIDLSQAAGILRRPGVLALCLAGLFHWLAMAPYNAFFGLHAARLGLSSAVVGTSMAVGGVSEIVFMLLSRPLERRFQPGRLVAFAMALTVLRWVTSALATTGPLLIVAQALHGLSFGMFYTASIAALIRVVPDALRATGQGLFMTAVFGVGGGFGTILFGELFAVLDGGALFLCSAAIEVLAVAVLLALDRSIIRRCAGEQAANAA